MQNKKKFTASFRRLFHNGAKKQDKQLFASWFSQLDLSEGTVFKDQVEENEMEKKMGQNLHEHFFNMGKRNKIVLFPYWLSTAAAAMLIIVSGVWFYNYSNKADHAQTFSEYATLTGQRKIITLPDGSVITLNNLSKVKFPQVFNDSLREVFLDGEAFFKITHNNKPFIVRTGKLNIQVLGTSFNIRNYKSDKMIDVVVATGKVGVNAYGSKDHTWMLTPGKKLTYNLITSKALEYTVDPADYTDWQNGKLVFKNERLEDICKRLQRWYGVAITIKTASLRNKRISLKLNKESLQTVFKLLGAAGEFKYLIKDKDVQVW